MLKKFEWLRFTKAWIGLVSNFMYNINYNNNLVYIKQQQKKHIQSQIYT